jgi:ferredoxin-NADP reductase
MEKEKSTSALKLSASYDEIDNVRTFVFETGGLHWLAGQSQGYILPQAGATEKENQHWFTISSAPSEGTINISTRISESAFKQALNAMKPGDEIRTHSLGGDFIWEEADGVPVTLVAAGIGVTPFRSILLQRKALEKPLNATLLYFNRGGGVPFEKELQKLSQEYSEFVLKIVVGEPITADKIFELAPQASVETVYLSGPAPMVTSIGSDLKERRVIIKQDWFPGYDEKNY